MYDWHLRHHLLYNEEAIQSYEWHFSGIICFSRGAHTDVLVVSLQHHWSTS